MKKSLFTLLAILLLFGCKPDGYKISGTTDIAALNGKQIVIKDRINNEWVTIDSTKIENGTFAFKGEADSSRIAYLILEMPSGEAIHQPFIIENGNITAKINDKAILVSGTQQNDLLQQYSDKKKQISVDAEKTYNQLTDTSLTEQQKQDIENKLKNFEAEWTNTDIEYATTHVNTIVGSYIFSSSYYNMDLAQKEKIVGLMSAETKKQEQIKSIIGAMEIEKKTTTGQKYTDITLPSIDGKSLSLSSLIGKTDYVLVDFWASWCGPCIQSMPEVKALYEKNKGKKLEILGVSLDEDENAWKAAISKHGLNWKHISDLSGWTSSGAKLYAINAIPATVLINKNGIIEGRNLSIQEIENIISKSIE